MPAQPAVPAPAAATARAAPAPAVDGHARHARPAAAPDDPAFERLLPAEPVACQLRLTPAAVKHGAILTGLAMLRRAGRIRLQVEWRPQDERPGQEASSRHEASRPLAILELEGGGSSVIDLDDDPGLQADELARHDLYFKRCFHAESLLLPDGHKLRPLPLLEDVRTDFLHLDELRGELAAANSACAKAGALARGVAQVVAARAGLGDRPNLSRMHAPPVTGQAQRVLAIWRLQDPEELPPEATGLRDACAAANRSRVQCIRALRRAYGSRFHGGILPDAFAARFAPDVLLASARNATRCELLRLTREHSVCVATSGPPGAGGLGIATFVAFSRAIVCEPLREIVAGDVQPGSHYLEYQTPEQCVARVAWLFDRPRERDEMARRNWTYYSQWQSAERLALRLVALTCAAGPRAVGMQRQSVPG
ncbi:MAG: hypothetical protein MUF07_13785 [Steroidobacteraceae bacterium]|nr:hypothetical protein [Steroidobacteraceae bacterium]